VAAGAALLLAGCGGASHTTSAVSAPGQRAAAGYRTYIGNGFQFAVPSAWGHGTSVSGTGGASGVALTAPDHAGSIDAHVYPHSNESVHQAIADDLTSAQVELSQGAISLDQPRVQTVHVPSAREAAKVTETFDNKAGRQRYFDLVVLTQAGTLIDLEATASAKAHGYDPAAVVESFQLAQGA
jgi:hypothetical protein